MSEPNENVGLLGKVKQNALGFAANTKAAAHLAARQAERTKITQATLPAAFHALGKDTYQKGRFKDEFPDQFSSIHERVAQITTVKEAKPVQGKHFSDKAKAAAQKTKDAATAKALSVKLDGELRTLGRLVYEKHGKDAGPAELVDAISQHHTRIAELAAEITEIDESHAGQWFTPKRIVFGGVGVVGLGMLLFVLSFFGGSKGSSWDSYDWDADYYVDFSDVDYSIPSVDYGKGPNGEQVVERDSIDSFQYEQFKDDSGTGRPTTEHGFVKDDGTFVLHGERAILHHPPNTGSKHRLEHWYDGELYGAFVAWDEEGSEVLKGQFRDGKLHGKYEGIQVKDGQRIRFEDHFVNGVRHGTVLSWYESNKPCQSLQFKDGKAHGRFVTHAENGVITLQDGYLDGLRHAPFVVRDENGQVLREMIVFKGKVQETDKRYRPDGTKWLVYTYKDGILHGEAAMWSDDGELLYEGQYVDGVPQLPTSNEVTASMTTSEFVSLVEELGGGFSARTVGSKTEDWIGIHEFSFRMGQPVEDNATDSPFLIGQIDWSQVESPLRRWTYKCKNGLVDLTVAIRKKPPPPEFNVTTFELPEFNVLSINEK